MSLAIRLSRLHHAIHANHLALSHFVLPLASPSHQIKDHRLDCCRCESWGFLQSRRDYAPLFRTFNTIRKVHWWKLLYGDWSSIELFKSLMVFHHRETTQYTYNSRLATKVVLPLSFAVINAFCVSVTDFTLWSVYLSPNLWTYFLLKLCRPEFLAILE